LNFYGAVDGLRIELRIYAKILIQVLSFFINHSAKWLNASVFVATVADIKGNWQGDCPGARSPLNGNKTVSSYWDIGVSKITEGYYEKEEYGNSCLHLNLLCLLWLCTLPLLWNPHN
jgi:hypothetical protein